LGSMFQVCKLDVGAFAGCTWAAAGRTSIKDKTIIRTKTRMCDFLLRN
jgi:hypothetical protein